MTAPIRAILFDRPAFDAWLATQPPERAQDIREGLDLCDWFDTEYGNILKEKQNDHPERND